MLFLIDDEGIWYEYGWCFFLEGNEFFPEEGWRFQSILFVFIVIENGVGLLFEVEH